MKRKEFITVLIINFVCVECNLLLLQPLEVPQNNQIEMPVEIVENYLHRYISQEQVFLSICVGATNDDQKELQRVFVSNIMQHSRTETISYNLLNSIHQSRKRNMNIFNLILVDGSASLM